MHVVASRLHDVPFLFFLLQERHDGRKRLNTFPGVNLFA